jgi:hypothetical protein
MSPDAELLVIFGVLHLVALVLGGALFLMFLRSDGASTWSPDDEDDSGGGGNDRVSDKPKTSPSGGIPLPFAVQSDKRLRSGHDKLAPPGRQLRSDDRGGAEGMPPPQVAGMNCWVVVYQRCTSAHAGFLTLS